MYLSPNVPEANRFHIFLLAVAIFLIGFVFYGFAFLRLPSSTQELLFLQEGKIALERHRASGSRPRRQTDRNA
jgi:hypothetical protein